MDTVRKIIKRLIPKPIFKILQPPYHYLLAVVGALVYRFPSKKLTVIGVTGTKGKSSTTEIITHILVESGIRTASLSTIQFSIAGKQQRNLFKMTMPGRFFVQKFLRQAVDVGCSHAVVEMTSEGAKQFRHKFIDLDALVFTNLTPEHIESHGSFEKYKEAKLSLAEALEKSHKNEKFLVVNNDDEFGVDFLNFEVENKLPYSLDDLTLHSLQKDSVSLVFDDTTIRVPLIGLFNVYNLLAAITLTKALGVPLPEIAEALRNLPPLKGRVQEVKVNIPNKNIGVFVDYAHTPDSLTKLYEAFPDQPIVGVLGNTGGGRDTWKRPEMGAIAEKYCEKIILTNEDPYDEDPKKIVMDMVKGMDPETPVEILMDRRLAIKKSLEMCPDSGVVLISGKGTDPFIMGPDGTKQPWSDYETVEKVAKELGGSN